MKRCFFMFVVTTCIALETCVDVESIKISKDDIDYAVNEIERYDEVIVANISIEEHIIFCILSVDSSVSITEKRQLGEEFAKLLSTRISDVYNIKAPNENTFGKLYDIYTLNIAIGTENDADIIFGGKGSNSSQVTW